MRTAVAGLAWLAILIPSGLAAQEGCGPGGAWVGVEAGAVRYPLAQGLNGAAAGIEAGIETRAAAFRLGYRALSLGNGRTTPHLVRASARRQLLERSGVHVCVTGHGGGTRLSSGDDHATVIAGGAGVAAARAVPVGNAVLVPFAELRGLAATSSGEVLDLDVGARGLSLGVEAGAWTALGRLLLAVTGSADGFAAGLGVTPYPALAARISVAYRF